MTATLEGLSGRRHFWLRGDIAPVRRPPPPADDWQDTRAALNGLREWVEAYATETINWYLRDKRVKRWASRLLRAAAVILASAGGIAPLVANSSGEWGSKAGYILLALAAGCVAFDHFFGLSAGWMRDIATAQALQARLVQFELGWAAWQAAEAGVLRAAPDSEKTSVPVRDALNLIEALAMSVVDLTESETAQWIGDFRVSIGTLGRQTGAPGPVVAQVPSENSQHDPATR